MPKIDYPSHAEVERAARQARAGAMRRWLEMLVSSLTAYFGTIEMDWKAWRGE